MFSLNSKQYKAEVEPPLQIATSDHQRSSIDERGEEEEGEEDEDKENMYEEAFARWEGAIIYLRGKERKYLWGVTSINLTQPINLYTTFKKSATPLPG